MRNSGRMLNRTEQRQQGRHCALIHLLRLANHDRGSAYKKRTVEVNAVMIGRSHNDALQMSYI